MQNIRTYARKSALPYRTPWRRCGTCGRGRESRSICAIAQDLTFVSTGTVSSVQLPSRLGMRLRSTSTIDQGSIGHSPQTVIDEASGSEVDDIGGPTFSAFLRNEQSSQMEQFSSKLRRFEEANGKEHMNDTVDSLKERFEELDFLVKDYASGERLEPLDGWLLISCLKSWQKYVFSTTDKFVEDMAKIGKPRNAQQRKGLARESAKEAEVRLGELSPKAMLQRLQRYYDEDSFKIFRPAFSLIVAAMTKASDLSQSPHDAHAFFLLLQKEADDESSSAITEPLAFQLINLWSSSGLKESLSRIDYYLETLERQYYEDANHKLCPSPIIYCTAMEAHAELGAADTSFNKIEDLFQRMLATSKDIDSQAYGRVCQAFAKCRHPKAADFAREALDTMCELYFKQFMEHMKPTIHAFSAVITAYGRSNRPEEAESLLDFMEKVAEEYHDPSFRPNFAIYKNVLWALSAVGNGPAAEAMVIRMTSDPDLQKSYSSEDLQEAIAGILMAWSKHGGDEGVENVARLVKHLTETDSLLISPLTAYNAMIHSYIGVKNPEFSARLAEDLFRWMENQEDADVTPDAWSYWNLLLVLKEAGFPERCESHLRRLMKAVEDGKIDRATVDQRFFSLVILAWADSDRLKAANRAHSVFRKMERFGIQPDMNCYSSLMFAYSRTKNEKIDPCDEVRKLFSEMRQRWSFSLDQKTCNAMITTFARSSDQTNLEQAQSIFDSMEQWGVRKNAMIYNSLMRGWSNVNDASRVESLFHAMKDGYDDGDVSLKPRFGDYAVRLRTWARVGEPEIALSVFEEMVAAYQSGLVDRDVSVREVNRLIESWGSSEKPDTAHMARATLSTIFKESFSSFRDILSSSETLLSSDQKAYLEKLQCIDTSHLSPDSVSCSLVISAYAKSGSPNAATKALQLLNIAEDLHKRSVPCLPNFLVYSEVIGALCREKEDTACSVTNVLDNLLEKDDKFWTLQLKLGLHIPSILRKLEPLIGTKSEDLRDQFKTLMEKLVHMDIISQSDIIPPSGIQKQRNAGNRSKSKRVSQSAQRRLGGRCNSSHSIS